MPRPKQTISRDSVFRGTNSAATDGPKQGIAPKEAATHQTAMWLGDDEIEWLDTQIQQIKRGGWRSVTRSALIRALVQAAMENPVTLTGVTGQEELIQRLSSRG